MEKWKDIDNFNYEVSTLGRVRNKITNYILKPIRCTNGYLEYQLNKDGKRYIKMAHRLVAQAFIPNLENKPQVNHRDENITNNEVENLEWVTAKENANYGTRNQRAGEKHRHPVDMYDLEKQFIKHFESATQCAKELGICLENITRVCKGKRKTAKGYIFKFSKSC